MTVPATSTGANQGATETADGVIDTYHPDSEAIALAYPAYGLDQRQLSRTLPSPRPPRAAIW